MKTVVGILLLTAIVSCTAFAGTVISIDAQDMPLAKAIDSLSRQSRALILIDEGVKGSVTATLNSVELEQAIDILSKSQGFRWRKLYAKPGQDGAISSSVARKQADALLQIPKDPMVVYDAATKSTVVYMRVDKEDTDSTAMPEVSPEKMGLKPFYVLSKIAKPADEAAAKPAVTDKDDDRGEETAAAPKTEYGDGKNTPMNDLSKQYLNLSGQKLDSYVRMTPEQRKQAATEEARWMLSLPPDLQRDMIKGYFGSADQLDPKSRAQWKQMVKSSLGIKDRPKTTRKRPSK